MLLVAARNAASRLLQYSGAIAGPGTISSSLLVNIWPTHLVPNPQLRAIKQFHSGALSQASQKLMKWRERLDRKDYHTSSTRFKSRASNKKKNYFMGERIVKSKIHPILKHKTVILVDDKGKIIDRLSSKMALGIVEGNRMEVKMVRKDDESGLPVFKMLSKKALYDEEKQSKIKNRKSRHDVMKELSVGSNIAEHDLAVKMKKAREFLEKGYSVRIVVELKIRKRFSPEQIETEEKNKERLLNDVTGRLSAESKSHVRIDDFRRKHAAVVFRPTKTLKVGDPGKPIEHQEEEEDEREEEEEYMEDSDSDSYSSGDEEQNRS